MIQACVRDLENGEAELWDELVSASPQGTIFHNYFWLESNSKLFNRELKIFGYFKGDILVGGCSLYIAEYKLIKFASSTVDLTPYGGLVFNQLPSSGKIREQESMSNEIINAIIKSIDVPELSYIKLTNSPGLIDIRPFSRSGWKSRVLYTYYFDLNGEIDLKISKKTRNVVRKAAKSRITIKKSRDVDAFYSMYAMTFERQGLKPPAPMGHIEKMIELIDAKAAGDMWIAETDSGVAVAAEIFIWDNKRAYRWLAASNPNYREIGAPSYLLHEVFQHLKENGFKEVNLMAANTPNLTKFISGFNPRLVPYYSVEKKSFLGKLGEICYPYLRRLRL